MQLLRLLAQLVPRSAPFSSRSPLRGASSTVPLTKSVSMCELWWQPDGAPTKPRCLSCQVRPPCNQKSPTALTQYYEPSNARRRARRLYGLGNRGSYLRHMGGPYMGRHEQATLVLTSVDYIPTRSSTLSTSVLKCPFFQYRRSPFGGGGWHELRPMALARSFVERLLGA